MTAAQEPPDSERRATLAMPLHGELFRHISSTIQVEVAAMSDSGKARAYNTDHYLAIRLGRLQETLITSLATGDLPPPYEEYGYLMLVADGLGDDGSGVRASRAALSALAHLAIRYGRWNVRIDPETMTDVIERGRFLYQEANEAVLQESRRDPRLADIATSLTAVYIAGTDLFYSHVGHSKAFLFRDGSLIQLTADQTLEQQELEAPRLRVLERSKVDLKHVVTETLGGRDGPAVSIERIQLWSGDRLVLCTNGLTDVVTRDQIADVLALRRQPGEDCKRLVELALAAGGPDNVTVMAADYTIRSAAQQIDTNAA